MSTPRARIWSEIDPRTGHRWWWYRAPYHLRDWTGARRTHDQALTAAHRLLRYHAQKGQP